MYNYFHLHIGIFLICLLIVLFITTIYFDPKKVYKWNDEDEVDESFLVAGKRFIIISISIFIIIEIFYMIIKHLIVQR